nr:MAG TPA: hypothetical protein [Caudoviricetes sp.]
MRIWSKNRTLKKRSPMQKIKFYIGPQSSGYTYHS